MKAYKIKVNTHNGMANWRIVSIYDDSYNSFDTLKEAKQFALDNMEGVNPSDLQGCRDRIKSTTLEEVFEDYFEWIAILEDDNKGGDLGVEGENDSPSPLSDFTIYNMMTSIKDSWHHFHPSDREDSLKNLAQRVFSVIKEYTNPDLDLNAIVKQTWLDQSYMGCQSYCPDEKEIEEFDEYIRNWKYPREKKL